MTDTLTRDVALRSIPQEQRPLCLNVACHEGRHKACDGASQLLRAHPTVSLAAQPLPCLCECHAAWCGR